MNKFDFYKELYLKEEEKKNQINNSLSLPISVISGLVAAHLYFLAAFDFQLNLLDSIIFGLISLSSIYFLGISVYHLIKSYSNFHNGYDYVYLADAIGLNQFCVDLKKYYLSNTTLIDTSETEFEQFILDELIKNTDANQKNNKKKNKHRFNCEKYLISAFLILCLNLFPYGYNYALKKDKKQSITLELNSIENQKFIESLILNHKTMSKDANQPKPPPTQTPQPAPVVNPTPLQKPTPPPSQIIKEGQDPRIKK